MMYEKNDKRRLYWLIDQYLSEKKINEETFCKEFHHSFNEVIEINSDSFTNIEYEAFVNLDNVSQYFSEIEEDRKLWAGFITEKQLRDKVLETKEKLKEQKILYDKTIRRKLYNILDQYLSNKIDEITFRDEFHDTFVNKVHYDGFMNIEYEIFYNLDEISQCFTENKEYFKLWAGYITAEQLKEKAIEAKNKLNLSTFLKSNKKIVANE